MSTAKQIERVSDAVEKYLEQNSRLVPPQHLNKETRKHILSIGTSIMCTKWKIGPPGGSFVQAICDNDLHGAFGRADSVNVDCIGFYVTMYQNLGYVD